VFGSSRIFLAISSPDTSKTQYVIVAVYREKSLLTKSHVSYLKNNIGDIPAKENVDE
jgi:hypothetical protein